MLVNTMDKFVERSKPKVIPFLYAARKQRNGGHSLDLMARSSDGAMSIFIDEQQGNDCSSALP